MKTKEVKEKLTKTKGNFHLHTYKVRIETTISMS